MNYERLLLRWQLAQGQHFRKFPPHPVNIGAIPVTLSISLISRVIVYVEIRDWTTSCSVRFCRDVSGVIKRVSAVYTEVYGVQSWSRLVPTRFAYKSCMCLARINMERLCVRSVEDAILHATFLYACNRGAYIAEKFHLISEHRQSI